MARFRGRHAGMEFVALGFIAVSMVTMPAVPQTPSPASQSSHSSKPGRHDSVEVVAHLSAEEVEDGKLTDVYEAVA